MRASRSARWRALAVVPLVLALAVPAAPAFAVSVAPATGSVVADPAATPELPDPLVRGPYGITTIQEAKLGTVDLQEPNSSGTAPTAGTSQAPEVFEVRGSLTYPANRTVPSPVVVFVHGNHGSCDSGQDSVTATCAEFKRNEAGYAYLAENLASWGYTTFSVSQDQLMMRQDNNTGKGMHQRRLLIAASLDALSAANTTGLTLDAHTTLSTELVGKLDLTRVGLMGHSRGGDAVTSFIDYNRERTDGARYPLRGVVALAPVDYERKAPTGVPFMTVLPYCDGDVSNLQGARLFERSQYVDGSNPFPSIQVSHQGANHNWYNTVWFADKAQDGNAQGDAACGNTQPTSANNVAPNNLRLSGAASYGSPWSYVVDNSDTYNPQVNTKISGDPARMGDQEKLGLATIAAFVRRYIGGEGAFEPYMTGELSDTASHLQVPESACPTSESGLRLPCSDRVATTYFAPSSERVDLIRPEVENPLTLNALGGALSGTGFANPYVDNGGVSPMPVTTAQGFDWCNPEPDDFATSILGKTTQPTGAKACPLPGKADLGGQNGTRESSPINHSYGRQLSLAWEAGSTASLTANIPAADSDLTGLKALALDADVNFFDARNPGGGPIRTIDTPAAFNPLATTQDFEIVLTDTAGNSASVKAGDPRWGNALHMSTGTVTPSTHIVLEQIRVPLSEFSAGGVDISSLASLKLQFGVDGLPASGSIQLADVRFQEKVADAPLILSDGTAVNQGAGYGPPLSGPDPADVLAGVNVTPGEFELPDTTANPWSNTTLVVDDDKQECPNAGYTSIQSAVDFAAPWDTIVVCDGTYQERSTPINSARVPVAAGALNGLTINKPLKIKGVGADRVTIMPDQTLTTLAGTTPYLRDGGGNVITVSRQSLGSTDTNEMFLDISGVTVTSGSTFAEAGIAFFNTAGRVSDSVVGPLRTAQDPAELAANPHGWGIVKAGFLRGSGAGTVQTELTVANTEVTGYQAGGILFDGAYGVDGAPSTVARAGLIQHGYVSGSVVTGSSSPLFPQTGVSFTSGFDGFIADSAITGNTSSTSPSGSVGVKLSDAATETSSGVEIRSSAITGNGIGVANLDATSSAPREAAPVTVRGSFVNGTSAPFSGADTTTAPSVDVLDPVLSVPASVPSSAGSVTDEAPSSQVVEPGTGLTLEVGDALAPIVRARDDFAVASVTLLADGMEVGTSTVSPYTFAWTAAETDAGKTVALTGVVTDVSGQTTVSAPIDVAVAAIDVPPTTEPTTPPTTEPTTPATTAPVPTEGAQPPAATAAESGSASGLAVTGVAAVGIMVVAGLLLLGGVLLVVIRRRRQRA